jgi:hypothetical protein
MIVASAYAKGLIKRPNEHINLPLMCVFVSEKTTLRQQREWLTIDGIGGKTAMLTHLPVGQLA